LFYNHKSFEKHNKKERVILMGKIKYGILILVSLIIFTGCGHNIPRLEKPAPDNFSLNDATYVLTCDIIDEIREEKLFTGTFKSLNIEGVVNLSGVLSGQALLSVTIKSESMSSVNRRYYYIWASYDDEAQTWCITNIAKNENMIDAYDLKEGLDGSDLLFESTLEKQVPECRLISGEIIYFDKVNAVNIAKTSYENIDGESLNCKSEVVIYANYGRDVLEGEISYTLRPITNGYYRQYDYMEITDVDLYMVSSSVKTDDEALCAEAFLEAASDRNINLGLASFYIIYDDILDYSVDTDEPYIVNYEHGIKINSDEKATATQTFNIDFSFSESICIRKAIEITLAFYRNTGWLYSIAKEVEAKPYENGTYIIFDEGILNQYEGTASAAYNDKMYISMDVTGYDNSDSTLTGTFIIDEYETAFVATYNYETCSFDFVFEDYIIMEDEIISAFALDKSTTKPCLVGSITTDKKYDIIITM